LSSRERRGNNICSGQVSKSRFILYDKNKIKNGELTLDQWFEYHIEHSDWICENCGSILQPKDEETMKSFQAHILPKNKFLSVATDINNRMLLGAITQPCSCHGQYDSNWNNAAKMPVFSIALERFPLFAHKLTDEEIRRLPEPFKMLLDA
jgi:hypothetical protein